MAEEQKQGDCTPSPKPSIPEQVKMLASSVAEEMKGWMPFFSTSTAAKKDARLPAQAPAKITINENDSALAKKDATATPANGEKQKNTAALTEEESNAIADEGAADQMRHDQAVQLLKTAFDVDLNEIEAQAQLALDTDVKDNGEAKHKAKEAAASAIQKVSTNLAAATAGINPVAGFMAGNAPLEALRQTFDRHGGMENIGEATHAMSQQFCQQYEQAVKSYDNGTRNYIGQAAHGLYAEIRKTYPDLAQQYPEYDPKARPDRYYASQQASASEALNPNTTSAPQGSVASILSSYGKI